MEEIIFLINCESEIIEKRSFIFKIYLMMSTTMNGEVANYAYFAISKLNSLISNFILLDCKFLIVKTHYDNRGSVIVVNSILK